MRSLRDIVPSIVVETCAGHTPPKLGSLSSNRSHPQGRPIPVKLASAATTDTQLTSAPAHAVRARVWVGNSKDDAPSVSWTLLNVKRRPSRRFSHFIYKQGGARVPIFR